MTRFYLPFTPLSSQWRMDLHPDLTPWFMPADRGRARIDVESTPSGRSVQTVRSQLSTSIYTVSVGPLFRPVRCRFTPCLWTKPASNGSKLQV